MELLGRIAALANQFAELESGLEAVLSEICGYTGWPVGHVFVVREEGFQDARIWHMDDTEKLASFQRASIDKALLGPHGLIHQALEKREPVSMSDVSRNPTFLRAREAREAGLRTGLAVPALIGDKVMAVLEFYSLETDAASSELLELLTIVGTVVGRMIERVRAEQRQREQATQYKLLFESTNDASFICTPTGEITATNAAAQRLVSYLAEDLVGRNIIDLVAPEFQGLARMRLEQQNGGGEANPHFEIALVDRAGRRIPVEVTTAFLRVHGRATAVQSTMRDMSDRLRAEVALKESEERFRRAFESAPIGMALNGPDGTWLMVNDALCELVGYSSEELMQMTHQDITHPDDVDTDVNNTRRLYDGETMSYETRKRYIHKNGATIGVLVRRSIVIAADGAPAFSIAQIVHLAAGVDPPSNGQARTAAPAREQLSRREVEVLALLAEGMTNESAAAQLSIGHETVQTYVRRAMKKLGAQTRTQAVACAMAQGVLSQHR